MSLKGNYIKMATMKTNTVNGEPTKTYIKIIYLKDNIIVSIERLLLSSKDKMPVETGYRLGKKFEDKNLYISTISFKLDSFLTVAKFGLSAVTLKEIAERNLEI